MEGAVDSLEKQEVLQKNQGCVKHWTISTGIKLNKGKCPGWGNASTDIDRETSSWRAANRKGFGGFSDCSSAWTSSVPWQPREQVAFWGALHTQHVQPARRGDCLVIFNICAASLWILRSLKVTRLKDMHCEERLRMLVYPVWKRGDQEVTSLLFAVPRGWKHKGRCWALFLGTDSRMWGNGIKLHQGMVRLDMRKNLFTMRVIKHWNRLSREMVETQH